MTNKAHLFLIPPVYVLAVSFFILGHLGVPIFYAESLILISALLIVASLLGVVLAQSGERLRTFVLAVLTISFLDVVFSGWDLLSGLIPFSDYSHWILRRGLRVIVFIVVFATVFWGLWLIRHHASRILAVVFGCFFATTVFSQGSFWQSQITKNHIKEANS